MGTKRPNTSVVLAQDSKRSKNDIVAYTNRDKALLESVSKRLDATTKKKNSHIWWRIMKNSDINCVCMFSGCTSNLKSAGAHNATGGARGRNIYNRIPSGGRDVALLGLRSATL